MRSARARSFGRVEAEHIQIAHALDALGDLLLQDGGALRAVDAGDVARALENVPGVLVFFAAVAMDRNAEPPFALAQEALLSGCSDRVSIQYLVGRHPPIRQSHHGPTHGPMKVGGDRPGAAHALPVP